MILRARLRGIPIPPWGYLLAAGLLPAPLRAQYGLRWSAAQRGLWWLFTHAIHVVMCRLAPARVRFWGHYHVAARRTAEAADGLRQALDIFQRIGAAEAVDVSAEIRALTDARPAGQGS